MNLVEKKWYRTFLVLSDFVAEKKRFPYKTEIYNGVRIGEWMQFQHKNLGSLNLLQLKCLESINFPSHQMTYREKLDFDWKNNLKLLRRYMLENDSREPSPQTIYEGVELGKWFEKIKRDYLFNRMEPKKVQDLKDNGIIITNDLEKNWFKNFEKLKRFVEEHHRMPARRDRSHALGEWIEYQMKKKKEGKLLEWQYNMMNSIGIFDLEKEHHPQQWDKMFEYYKSFYEQNGRNPKRAEKYEQHTVGAWFHRQKEIYVENKLVKRRLDLILSVCPNAFDNLLVSNTESENSSDNQ